MAVVKFLMFMIHVRVLFFNRSLGGSVRGERERDSKWEKNHKEQQYFHHLWKQGKL